MLPHLNTFPWKCRESYRFQQIEVRADGDAVWLLFPLGFPVKLLPGGWWRIGDIILDMCAPHAGSQAHCWGPKSLTLRSTLAGGGWVSIGAAGLPLVDFFSPYGGDWEKVPGAWGDGGRLTGSQYKNLERDWVMVGWFSGTQEGPMHLTLLALLWSFILQTQRISMLLKW